MRLSILLLLLFTGLTLSACSRPEISIDPPEALVDEQPDKVEQRARRDREICVEKDPVTRLCK